MSGKKSTKLRLGRVFFGFFFAIMSIFSLFVNVLAPQEMAYAVPAEESGVVTEENTGNTETTETTEVTEAESNNTERTENSSNTSGDSCKDSLGAIGWLVCPTTGAISGAVDWLFDKIEEILVINPVSTEDGSPIYEIWKYCRGVTNIVFIIFLLVIVYSQITGLGITNYGIKRALPKLIVTAILVNLSFIICSLAVDISNIIGNGLRSIFTSVEEAALATSSMEMGRISLSSVYSALAGGSALGIGALFIAFETGAIWMLIPVVLGAIVAVVTGLITIALRQAVVALLIMISPLAIVAYILPNTEKWFTKWKELLTRMLVFYPMFSLLFGASSLAGFAIIMSATDGFWLLLGIAVQIFPLFFSWKLMQMSGTFLGDINAKLRGLAATPLARNRAWADSHRQLSRGRHLTSASAYTPSARLAQFMANRKVAREAEIGENEEFAKKRGLAYYRGQRYLKDNSSSKKGIEAYRKQALSMEYDEAVLRDDNNMNKGLGDLRANAGSKYAATLAILDRQNVISSDRLKAERSRGEMIEYQNAVGFHKRMEDAVNAHFDEQYGELRDQSGRLLYRKHEMDTARRAAATARFETMNEIMEGNLADVQYAAAGAAHAYDTQKKIIETKYQKYFELTPPTKDVVYRLGELTRRADATEYIDAIIPGMRILNQRGDTDLVKDQLDNLLNLNGGVQLGTHASQSLASFLMHEVKSNDPGLRRFGKYLNLETARVYNKNEREVTRVTYDEYIKGYHDGETHLVSQSNPTGRMYAKKSAKVLLEGTSFDDVERTAFDNLDDSIRKAYTDENGNFDEEGYFAKKNEIQKAIGSQFISACTKYLTGSEQLKSAVKFLTGYSQKQKKNDDGSIEIDAAGNPVYEWKAVWDEDDCPFRDRARLKNYHTEKLEEYIEGLTPAQALGFRSDLRDPTQEILFDKYISDPAKRAEYEARRAEIQTRYADEPPARAEELRKRDLDKLKMDITGSQFREILGRTGKYKQMFMTRHSSMANNAKDFTRDWLLLGDEHAMRREVQRFDEERMRSNIPHERPEGETDDDGYERVRIYSVADQAEYLNELEDFWNNNRQDLNEEEFYDSLIEMIDGWFGENSDGLLRRRFEEYYDNGAGARHPSVDELKSKLEELLRDMDNYPDA